MNITLDHIYWHYYCISQMFRERGIGIDLSIERIYELIPYGIINQSVIRNNSAPVCDWVMEYLGYKYDEEKDGWFK